MAAHVFVQQQPPECTLHARNGNADARIFAATFQAELVYGHSSVHLPIPILPQVGVATAFAVCEHTPSGVEDHGILTH